ncbi:hypothetical protein [Enterococcus faecalis]
MKAREKKYEIKKILDYTDEEERYTLLNGEWYSYNNDYIDYLNDSLSEIPVIYNPEYDFSKKGMKLFVLRNMKKKKIDLILLAKQRKRLKSQ